MTDKMIKEENNSIRQDEAPGLVREEVGRCLKETPLIIREYTSHLLASQGKNIRAASVITAAEDKDGNVSMDAVRIASAIEIVHLASLVHDDVMDDADIRRGKETLQRKYGKKTAVICGDYLLSLALRKAASISIKKELLEKDLKLQDYIGKLCLGELYQHINNGNTRLTAYQYLKIISGKTAALFEASFLAGAIISGADEKETKKYRRLGFYIGMIFQLTDDCNDFVISEEVATKPVQSDFEQGVITLPLIHAFESKPDFREKAAAGKVSRKQINEAVESTGGLSFTRSIIKAFYKKAMRIIEILDASDDKKKRLVSILDKASRMI